MNDHDTQLVIAGGGGHRMFEEAGAQIVKTWKADELETPYGKSSGAIFLMRLNGKSFFCFSRHGDQEQLAPYDIPYLANAYALKQLGAKYWVAMSLSTSLSDHINIGSFVIPDTYYDHNTQRDDQFFTKGKIGGVVSYTDTFNTMVSGPLKTALIAALKSHEVEQHHNAQTETSRIADKDIIVFAGMPGPHTGTRADQMAISNLFSNAGGIISGMTNMTEALVAKQAGIDYASLSFIGGRDLSYRGDDSLGADETNTGNAIQRYIDSFKDVIVPVLSSVIAQELPYKGSPSDAAFYDTFKGAKGVEDSQLKEILRVLKL